MPKRGGGQRNARYEGGGGSGRFSSLKDYSGKEYDGIAHCVLWLWNLMKLWFFSLISEHDDRDRAKERNSTRRVSFKPSQLQSKSGLKDRMAEMAIRSRLEDDDEMGDLDRFYNESRSWKVSFLWH